MNLVIFDTSILVDLLRAGRHQENIRNLTGLIRSSSVVLAELLRGASKTSDRNEILDLARLHPILSPTQKNWLQSGEVLRRMRADLGFTSEKLRDLHFDVLIALTARSHGARLITSNRADFEAIRRYRKFEIEVW